VKLRIDVGDFCANIWILFLVLFMMYCYVGESSGGTEMESFFLEGCVDGPLKSFYCNLRDHRYYHFDPIFSLMLDRQ